ncbi:MAG: UbiD family decarboxylase [Candidatus Tectomicrobia bacterium]|nr:UbiD family decarboxylase [Candidatus Tectomicrobia bacterium]
MAYKDLRDFINDLDQKGLLYRVKRTINKDTELMPLVRWQFRGLPSDERKAFLFESLTDSRGRSFDAKVAVGILGASRPIYAAGMGCKVEEIQERWVQAQRFPIPPKMVDGGPVKEVILQGDALLEAGGIDKFPIPISTPGYDTAPYLSSPYVVTKDPETSIVNVGTYRGMIKGRTRTGIMTHGAQHIGIHLEKARRLGQNLPAAIILGCVPYVGMCSVAKIPYGVNEYDVAGGLAGAPIELVKCETVDLEVPATSEIVVEGELSTEYLEDEAPFGEYSGYMGERAKNHVFNISCITHRRKPIYQAFISQFPPSESSMIRKISYDALMLKFLKYDCNIPTVQRVAFHEMSGSWMYIVIQLDKTNPSQPWQALNAAVALDPTIGKIIITVDPDIDPDDPESVNWALSFCMQPHLDVRITTGKSSMLDPSAAPSGTETEDRRFPKPVGTSAMLIDATRKHAYPTVSLPAKEYMDHAKEIWEELGLPPLKTRYPYHGYALGYWPEEWDKEAQMAVQGLYLETGEKLAQRRKPFRGWKEAKE